jgi:type 1 glutamine amidotransferase
MRVKKSAAPLLVGVCAAALFATALGQAEQAPQGQAGAPGQPAGQRAGGAGRGGGRGPAGPQNQVPNVIDVQQMLAALPETAPATPCNQAAAEARAALANCAADRNTPRRVLVLAKAASFVHSSIPLASRMIEALGNKTGAWTTVISYDPAVITAENLQQYDAIFLASTTGSFLDEPNNQAVTDARRKAFMDFVRGGKGVAGIHAATDSYHGGGGPGGGQPLWPEFNTMIGGYFKYHWNMPTQIYVKIDDPTNPINAAFRGRGGQPQSFAIVDEVYTFNQNSWSRDRVRVLTSIDYARMPAEVKAQEPAEGKRTDGDYGLSYIRREGNGRVFVQVLGHDESIYKIRPMQAHILAGMQYVLGDLKADDTPSGAPKPAQ